jgi:hypothetical protein
MREMYRILAVLGWVWCAAVFVILAVKGRRAPRDTNSDEQSRVAR